MARTHQPGKEEQERLDLISAVDLFSGLIDEDLAYVASRSCLRSVRDGETLFSAGMSADRFFVVKSGSVSVMAKAGGTNAVELARYEPLDVFGDFHFAIGGAYDATALARGDGELLAFPGDGLTFDRLAAEKPDTASRILLRSIASIDERIRTTRALIAENAPWVRELRKLIFVDQATGLWNKSFADGELPQQLGETATVLMVKPDNFKELNDTLGHAGGDEVIQGIANLLTSLASREGTAWAVRLRSNEMGLVISDPRGQSAASLAEEIQRAFPGILKSAAPELAGLAGIAKAPAFTASIAIGRWPDDGKGWKSVFERTNALLQDVWKAGGARTAHLRDARS